MSGFVFSSIIFVAGLVLGFAGGFMVGVASSGAGNVSPTSPGGPHGNPWLVVIKLLSAFWVSVRSMFGGAKSAVAVEQSDRLALQDHMGIQSR